MEIKPSQFDMTNPFAPLQQRINQVETVLRQLPAVQREQLLAERLQAIPARQSSLTGEHPVPMVTVKVAEWNGGPVTRHVMPTTTLRPRRDARYIPWQWRSFVAGIRLIRILRKSAKKQMKQFKQLQRQMIRRVLPRQ